MKSTLLWLLSLLPAANFLGCASQPASKRMDPPAPIVLGQAHLTEGTWDAWLSLIWTGGNHWLDEEPSYQAGEKLSGRFLFRVEWKNGQYVDTELETLGADAVEFFFYSGRVQTMVTEDYNEDGNPDFNILFPVGWGTANSYLFTVMPSGRVQPLTIKFPPEDTSSALFVNTDRGDQLSTADFELTPGGFYFESYLQRPREKILSFLDWDRSYNAFIVRQQVIELR